MAASTSGLRGLWLVVIGLLIAGPVSAGFVGRRGDDAQAVALATIAASAATVAEAKTVTATTTMTMRMPDGTPFVMRSTTAVDNEAKTGRFTITYDGTPLAEMDGVFTLDRMYFRLPAAARLRSGGKLWVAANPRVDAASEGSNPAKTGTALLEDLAGASGDVKVKGVEDIDGVRTTHYRVDIDLTDLQERGRRTQARLDAAPFGGSAPEVKITSETADVWLDDDGRPRRVRMVTTIAVGGEKTATTTDSRYVYDQPVLVWLPPDDQVADVGTIAEAAKLLYESTAPSS